MPLVSVVIPTYNRRTFVLDSLQSVLRQTHRHLEVVVVDDGSQDGTADLLRERCKDPRVRVVEQDNRGASAARNRGVRESSGQWVAFLDSDDSWLEGKVEAQLGALASLPEVPACYTEEIWYRRGKWANPRKVHAKHSGRIFSQCLPLCIISPSSALIRRSVLEALGGFDESLPACEDYDLWLRLTARHPVHLVPQKLIIKRNGHEGQLSQEHWALDRFRVRALWNLVRDRTVPWDLRRQALEVAAEKSAVVAQGARKRGAQGRAEVFEFSREEALRWLQREPGRS